MEGSTPPPPRSRCGRKKVKVKKEVVRVMGKVNIYSRFNENRRGKQNDKENYGSGQIIKWPSGVGVGPQRERYGVRSSNWS
jgi:hypothetical protein